MSIRKVSFATGEFYHVYNRGNDKREIFHDRTDYLRFLKALNLLNSSASLSPRLISGDFFIPNKRNKISLVGCYCLLPNHFHLILKEIEEGGISKFMQKITTSYAMYYNQKYNRTGSLFEGKFKSKHIGDDGYFRYLFSYIHLNPIKLIEPKWKTEGIKNYKNALEFLEEYEYSSYRKFLKGEDKYNILDLSTFPEYFPTKESFQKDVFDWLNYGKEDLHDEGG